LKERIQPAGDVLLVMNLLLLKLSLEIQKMLLKENQLPYSDVIHKYSKNILKLELADTVELKLQEDKLPTLMKNSIFLTRLGS
jgi:hypothetical protein